MIKYLNENSNIDATAKIYNNVRTKKSIILADSSIGDNSRVDYSKINEKVRIDRNNQIYKSSLSNFTYTGMNTVIMHAEIGAFTSISWNVSIGGAEHDYSRMTQHSFLYNSVDSIRPDEESEAYDRFINPIVIGNDVWVAAGAVITRGVTIGDGAVIGANSVVTKDVPPYAIVAGSPAKVIKYRFPPEVIDLLLNIKWWNWPLEKIKNNYHLLSEAPTFAKLSRFIKGM
jgi:virginiamycin A acetyltransferase